MPDLYACRLPLRGDGLLRFDQAVAAVRSEVASATGAKPSGECGSAATARARLRWSMLASPDGGQRVWTVSWDVHDRTDDDTTSTVMVKVALDEGDTSVVVRSGLVVRGTRLGRLRLGLEPPRLVGALATALRATEDGLPLSSEPRHVDDGEGIRRLVALLHDPERVLPVVVVSMANHAGTSPATGPGLLVDGAAVARSVVGVAHVVVLDSTSASFSLTRLLGRDLSVYDGAVRLYWPGAAAMADPRQNTLLLSQVRAYRATASVRRALVRRLMPVAVVHFSSAALEASIRAAVDRDSRSELRRSRARAPDVACEQQLRAARADNQRLRRTNVDLADQLAASQEDLRTIAARWVAASVEEAEPQDDT